MARYSQYADDITFSFRVGKTSKLPAAACSVDANGDLAIGTELHDVIVNKHHFKINSTKTSLSDRARRMEVTGLTINRFPNVPRVFIDRIRGALNAWEKYGYDQANKTWQTRVTAAATGAYEKKPWKRQTRTGLTPALKNVLWGKLLYLRMVRGKDDLIYTRLAERYNAQSPPRQRQDRLCIDVARRAGCARQGNGAGRVLRGRLVWRLPKHARPHGRHPVRPGHGVRLP